MTVEERRARIEPFLNEAPTGTIQNQISRSEVIIGKALSQARIFGTCVTCSVSGGSDSDILIDFVTRFDDEKNIKYVWFDTGIEMEATKEHLFYLEEHYGIKIERIKAKLPVPAGCRKHGVPFISKTVSSYMGRLQKHGFTWENGSFSELYQRYPKCKAALKWWCNAWEKKANGRSRFDIRENALLKEFIMANPPSFQISAMCCDGAKKDTAEIIRKLYHPELNITGIRKAEGGQRSTAVHTCFDPDNSHGPQHYPLFYFTDIDKQKYVEKFQVRHSKAYTDYGCSRTGCSGCPFGSRFEEELLMLERWEPKLCKAAKTIFHDSYEYTRAYRRFKGDAK